MIPKTIVVPLPTLAETTQIIDTINDHKDAQARRGYVLVNVTYSAEREKMTLDFAHPNLRAA